MKQRPNLPTFPMRKSTGKEAQVKRRNFEDTNRIPLELLSISKSDSKRRISQTKRTLFYRK